MADDDLEFITPPHPLKSKVPDGAAGVVDNEVIERAQHAIDNMTDEYLEWVQKDIAQIESALDDVKANTGDRSEKLQDIFKVSHDIKGQGGSFGYDLMTIIGNQICRLIEAADPQDRNLVEVIDVHVGAMKLIVSTKLKKTGGREGELMLAGLEKVCGKILG